MSAPQLLKVAFCLCDGVTLSDFVPPAEILAGLNLGDTPLLPAGFGPIPYRLETHYLAPTLDPVKNLAGVPLTPTQTYVDAREAGTQYDILWVPAGPVPNSVTGEDLTPQEEVDFIAAQAPKAKYVMSVCGGSFILARAGVLSGKRATTNKAVFKIYEAMSPKDITWVVKARWVVDGNIWTSSGVSAGSDMALAFLAHLAGDEISTFIRGVIEIPKNGQEDDPFAAFHGLV